MPDATFVGPDLTTFCRTDELAWMVVGQRLEPHRAVLGCRERVDGLVDLTRDKDGRTRARLLDLIPGRSGTVYADWLKERGDGFRQKPGNS